MQFPLAKSITGIVCLFKKIMALELNLVSKSRYSTIFKSGDNHLNPKFVHEINKRNRIGPIVMQLPLAKKYYWNCLPF